LIGIVLVNRLFLREPPTFQDNILVAVKN